MRGGRLAAATLLLLLAPPAAAQDVAAIRKDLAALVEDVEAGRCGPAEKRAARLLATSGLVEELRFHAAVIRLSCLYILKRPSDARAAAFALGNGPDAARMFEAWFVAAMDFGAVADAVEALGRAIAIDPAHVRVIDPAEVGYTLAALRQAGEEDARERIVLMLADIGFGGDAIAVRDGYQGEAVALHLKAGRVDEAERLARQLVWRDSLVGLLTDRVAERLWPMLEASAGPGMARTNRAALEAARNHAATLGPAEESAKAAQGRQVLMEALWNAGEREAALAEGAKALATPEALSAAGEDQAWVVNKHALYLARAGQVEAGIERMRALAGLDIAKRPWLISMRINLALMLLHHGRAGEVAAMGEALMADAEAHGSPYARQLVRWARTCALVETGRMAEAAALRPAVVAHAADSRSASADALLCLGEREAAAAMMVGALEDARGRARAIADLQPDAVWPDPRSPRLPGLRDMPEVAAAFAREGRVLPERLWPGAGEAE